MADFGSAKKGRIERFKLEVDAINLRKAGLSFQAIANELNKNPAVPEDEQIDKHVVMRFFEKIPEVQRQLVREDKKRLVQVVNQNMDIISEMNELFGKSKMLLNYMEDKAYNEGKMIDPYRFKAVSSEMREMLKQMTDVQKEISDYDNIRKFMEIVMETLKSEAPESIPTIVQKLRMAQGTNWFANMIGGKDNE